MRKVYTMFYRDLDGYEIYLASFSNKDAALETMQTQITAGWYSPKDAEIIERHGHDGRLTGWVTRVALTFTRRESMFIRIDELYSEPVDM